LSSFIASLTSSTSARRSSPDQLAGALAQHAIDEHRVDVLRLGGESTTWPSRTLSGAMLRSVARRSITSAFRPADSAPVTSPSPSVAAALGRRLRERLARLVDRAVVGLRPLDAHRDAHRVEHVCAVGGRHRVERKRHVDAAAHHREHRRQAHAAAQVRQDRDRHGRPRARKVADLFVVDADAVDEQQIGAEHALALVDLNRRGRFRGRARSSCSEP
jgi:hypothetical protein